MLPYSGFLAKNTSYWIERTLSQSEGLYLTKEYYFDKRHRFYFDGCENAHTIEDVFELCKDEEEIFTFGGEQIYNMFLPNV